jgi:hypothetical protein
MNKYHNGKIYSIRSYQTDKFYIGSTCSPLYKRLYQHRSNYKINKVKVSSYEILQYEDHYIELIEDVKCENKEQLLKIEGEHIRKNLNNVVNIHVLGLTRKESVKKYNDNHKEEHKEYREKHKEKIKDYQKKYREANKDIYYYYY